MKQQEYFYYSYFLRRIKPENWTDVVSSGLFSCSCELSYSGLRLLQSWLVTVIY